MADRTRIVIIVLATIFTLGLGTLIVVVVTGDDDGITTADADLGRILNDADDDHDTDGATGIDGDQDATGDSDTDSDTDPDEVGDAGGDTAALDEFVGEAMAFIEGARGRPFVQRPEVVVMDEAEFVAWLQNDLEQEFAENPEIVTEANVLYRGLGLIDPGESIDDVYGRFVEAGVLGLYEPETEELLVRAADELSLLTKSTIVHELVHAYDDQLFDLDRPELEDLWDEQPWTFRATAEGSASHVTTLWTQTLSPDDARALRLEEASFGDPAIVFEFELSFLLLEISPYQYGEPYIARLVEAGGWSAVDAALLEPDLSSERIIEAAGGPGLDPVDLPFPAVDGEILIEGVGGQVLLDSIFTGTGAGTSRAASGWGGDALVAYIPTGNPAESCVRWDLVADSGRDFTELRDALQNWVDQLGGDLSEPTEGVLRVDRCV